MPRQESGIELVRKLAMKLPDVEEGTLHGAPSWKLGGKLLTCPAIHKSAEANSLLIKIDPAERGPLISTEPGTYYVTDHYRSSPVVLVRLSKIDRKSLQALLKRAWLLVSESGNRGGRKAGQTDDARRATAIVKKVCQPGKSRARKNVREQR